MVPVAPATRENRFREVALETPAPHDDVSPRLVEAARRGEHKAFVAILRHYDRRLRLIAFRLLRDRDLMDDALQDVAIKAFRALPGFRGDASVGTWLYRITYTTCLDYLRRSRPVELFPSDEVPEPATLLPDTADVVTDRDLLTRRLAMLTPEQRMAVLLVDQEGFDYRTAGEILGVPPGTIGSRLSAAHTLLRRSLAPVYRADVRA
jgi:RNA polymerase sigma-70 factor (ECF subfamily)